MTWFGQRTIRWALGAGGLLAVSVAHAQVLNGSFEENGGSFNAWGTRGNTTIQSAALGTGPTHGQFDALLATATDGTGGVPAGPGSPPEVLETFLGLASGTLQGMGNGTPLLGSAIMQPVTVSSAGTLSFDWNFLTNQTYNDGTSQSIRPSLENNDFAFVMVRPSGGSASLAILADTFYGFVDDPSAPGGFITGFTITNLPNPFISETGFHSWTMNFTQGGTFDLAMGVLHVTTGIDNGVNSALLVDNVQFVPVPEPASLVALGMASLITISRRRRNRS